MASFLILVGSFSNAGLISTLNFTISPPSLSLITSTPVGTNPTWIQSTPKNSTLIYATDEIDAGGLHSLSLDLESGNLTLIDTILTQGSFPTHIAVLQNGTQLGVANFGGGSAFFAGLEADSVNFIDPGQLVSFQEVGTSNAHQVVEHGDEILVPDLGLDRVWRLTRNGTDLVAQDFVEQAAGSGPRHVVAFGEILYTLHEKANTLTQHTLPSLESGETPELVANFTVIPPDTDPTAVLGAGELLFAQNPIPLLYASNRNDPHPDGDAIAIFETTPELALAGHVRTGLKHLRAVSFGGADNEFLIVGGKDGGGIKIYERVSAEQGFLVEVASLPAEAVKEPSSFVVVL